MLTHRHLHHKRVFRAIYFLTLFEVKAFILISTSNLYIHIYIISKRNHFFLSIVNSN